MLVENFAVITNSFADPYFLLTQDGTVLAVNQAAQKKFNLLDNKFGEIKLCALTAEAPGKIEQLLQMWARSRSPLPGKITFNIDQETPTHYLCKGSVIQTTGNSVPALIMLQCHEKPKFTTSFITLNENIEQLRREIIHRRNAENQVNALNQELEQRIKERTAELLNTNIELTHSLKKLKNAQEQLIRTERLASLGSMIAGIAHEINTPIGACITASSYLKEQVSRYQNLYNNGTLTRSDFEALLDAASESSTIVEDNLIRSSDLVLKLKQLAVDQSSEAYRQINIKSYIEELLTSLRLYFKGCTHVIQFKCPHDIEIKSQPSTLTLIIDNLIENSMRHGFKGIESGVINIEISRKKKHILLHYSDNGVGIPAQYLKQIFDPFFTTQRGKGDSGLGMNIVYNLVKNKLAGNISVTSEALKGVDFHIKFPVSQKNIQSSY